MIGVTGSASSGNVSPWHDLRDEDSKNLPENVDHKLTKDNVILVDELNGKTPEQYIDTFYKNEINEYNKKQKRESRKIHIKGTEWASPIDKKTGLPKYEEYSGYCDYHNRKLSGTRNKNKIVNEMVFQIGENATLGHKYYTATGSEKEKQHSFYVNHYSEMLKEFQKQNPHIHVLYASIHFDEPNGTPHMHIGYFGEGEGYSQGLNKRASVSKALTLDGIPRAAKRSDSDGFQKARWYSRIHTDIIKPGIEKDRQQIESILGDSIYVKPVKHGEKHVNHTDMDERRYQSAREQGQADAMRSVAPLMKDIHTAQKKIPPAMNFEDTLKQAIVMLPGDQYRQAKAFQDAIIRNANSYEMSRENQLHQKADAIDRIEQVKQNPDAYLDEVNRGIDYGYHLDDEFLPEDDEPDIIHDEPQKAPEAPQKPSEPVYEEQAEQPAYRPYTAPQTPKKPVELKGANAEMLARLKRGIAERNAGHAKYQQEGEAMRRHAGYRPLPDISGVHSSKGDKDDEPEF